MNDRTNPTWFGLLLLGIFLAAGIVVATFVIAKTIERVKFQNQRIQVKGFAERTITSDIAVWKGQITVRSPELVSAYNKLQADVEKVLSYLGEQGIKKEDVGVSSVSTIVQYKKTEKGMATNIIDGYVLGQTVELTSSDVSLIAQIAAGSTSLIKEGIEFSSYAPQYFYTKLDDMKIELLGEATKNALMRAGVLAKNSGSEIGTLKYASQGVFQITPVYSTQVSDYGVYNTTTIEKSIKAVVTIEYSIR
ncbi:SIMPL domain-containing protein [Desulfobacterota bacterium AH_259_B03_O07]|nr:SIMPL domain-containing protein [Desulfobacterota bacterium AH_259_B03_O07]